MKNYAHNPRNLVKSGPGFLGSHLSQRLIAEESDVICLYNFFTGNKDNRAHLVSRILN
jgi:UDP-glucuronate decarboxylase